MAKPRISPAFLASVPAAVLALGMMAGPAHALSDPAEMLHDPALEARAE